MEIVSDNQQGMSVPEETTETAETPLVAQILGFPYDTDEAALQDFFKGAGKALNIELGQGNRKGTAVITFSTQQELDAAIKLDGEYIGARWVKVRLYRERPPRNGRADRSPQAGPGDCPEGCTTLFCGNLSFQMQEQNMRELFADCGEISEIRWGVNRNTGKFRGYAHVDFSTTEGCIAAAKKHGVECLGRDVRLDFAAKRVPRPDRKNFTE